MPKLVLPCVLGLILAGEASAWAELEDEDGYVWECVGNHCYRDEDSRNDRNAPAAVAVQKAYRLGTTDDLLAFPKPETGRDPLAFPENGDKSKDPLAF